MLFFIHPPPAGWGRSYWAVSWADLSHWATSWADLIYWAAYWAGLLQGLPLAPRAPCSPYKAPGPRPGPTSLPLVDFFTYVPAWPRGGLASAPGPATGQTITTGPPTGLTSCARNIAVSGPISPATLAVRPPTTSSWATSWADLIYLLGRLLGRPLYLGRLPLPSITGPPPGRTSPRLLGHPLGSPAPWALAFSALRPL